MLHMPSPMLLGGAAEDLYPLFLAKITTLSTGGLVSWPANAPTFASGLFRVQPAAGTGTMTGTSWNAFFLGGASWSRIVQHALPSSAAFNGLAATGHQVFLQVTSGNFTFESDGPYGVNRNGYTSLTFASGEDGQLYPAGRVVDLIRFDAETGKAWRSNPSIGSAETEYNFRT